MLTRSLSKTIHNQVKSVVEDLVHKVAIRKKVSWASNGVTEARTFEIEPWRRIRPTPPTRIRSADKEAHDEPFTLPDAPMMKPLADYSDYDPPKPQPTATMAALAGIARRADRTVPSPQAECELVLIDDDDDDKKPSSAAPLARTQPVSLAVIYAIAEELRKVKNMNEFIKESEKMELKFELDEEFDVWAEDMYNE
jgi:hypothetical protein